MAAHGVWQAGRPDGAGAGMTAVDHLTLSDVTLRLGVATLVGGAIGLDRDLRGKPAGMRTLALVTLGSALLSAIGADLVALDGRPDPLGLSRVIQGIVAGIGFLGGGVILRDEARQSVQGLTTAAAVWVAASLGVACGVGFWRLVVVALVLTLAVLNLGGPLERGVERAFGASRDRPPAAAPQSRPPEINP